jgi:N-acyl-D-amino-acid deacylase
LLDFLAAKRAQGIDLTADEYPYTAGYTGIAILFPEWALPPTDYAAVVAARRQELRDYLEKRMIRRGGPEALLLGSAPYAGKTVAQAPQRRARLPRFPDQARAAGQDRARISRWTKCCRTSLIVDPFVAISTDGGPGMRHPRATGTYAKLIEQYVVRDRKLPIEAAVRKAAGLPATILRLADRGVIRVGAVADCILFDPAKVKGALHVRRTPSRWRRGSIW